MRHEKTQRWICAATTALFLTTTTLLATTGCGAALTQDIHTEAVADEKVNFAGMKTYAWFGGLGVVRDDTGKWNSGGLDITSELKFLIDRELRKRGYTQASGDADFYVGFLVAAKIAELGNVEERGGNVSKIEGAGEGGLLIELIDGQSQRTIWLGVATADVQTGRSVDDMKKRLDFAVTELVGKLPR